MVPQGYLRVPLGYRDLAQVDLCNTEVEGDIASMSGLVNLTELYLCNTQIEGDIASETGLPLDTSGNPGYPRVPSCTPGNLGNPRVLPRVPQGTQREPG